jgi:hypothetical protein
LRKKLLVQVGRGDLHEIETLEKLVIENQPFFLNQLSNLIKISSKMKKKSWCINKCKLNKICICYLRPTSLPEIRRQNYASLLELNNFLFENFAQTITKTIFFHVTAYQILILLINQSDTTEKKPGEKKL